MRFIATLTLSLALAVFSSAQSLSQLGTLAHFQSGGGWRTSFFLFNTGQTTAPVQLNFYNDQGQPAVIPLRTPQLGIAIEYPPASEFSYNLAAGSVLELESDSSDPTGTTGWANLQAGSNVTGYLIFRYAGLDGSGVQEAVVTPETRNGKSYVMAFDNTNEHFTSYAVANITSQPVNVTVTARDAVTGNVLGSPIVISLPAMNHEAKLLSNRITATSAASGTIEFSTPSAGQISVLGLRFTWTSATTYAFTSTPPILKQ